MTFINQLIFPNLSISNIPKVFVSTLDVIKGLAFPVLPQEKNKDTSAEELIKPINDDIFPSFNNDNISSIQTNSKTLRPCAVGEFEYDFTSSNPMNWDLQEFVLDEPASSNSMGSSENMSILFDMQNSNHTFKFDFLHNGDRKEPLNNLNNNMPSMILPSSRPSSSSSSNEFEDDTYLYNSDVEDDENDVDYYEDNIKNDDDFALDDELCMQIGREGPSKINSIITKLPLDILTQITGVDFTNLKRRRNSLEQYEDEELIEEELVLLTDEAKRLKKRLTDSSTSPIDEPAYDSSSSNASPTDLKITVQPPAEALRSNSNTLALSNVPSTPNISNSSYNSSDIHPFKCTICHTSFKVKSYLTRHMKKHESRKPFTCPFYSATGHETSDLELQHHARSKMLSSSSKKKRSSSHKHTENIGTNCHPTGGFSRRDTFKTHLKAIHFVYPTGTKSSGRGDTPGRCAGCYKQFKNNNDWLENHIETNKCSSMVTKYK